MQRLYGANDKNNAIQRLFGIQIFFKDKNLNSILKENKGQLIKLWHIILNLNPLILSNNYII